MAGLAPFGRDDQPTLEVRIVGGKQVEVAIDKSGKTLGQPTKLAGVYTQDFEHSSSRSTFSDSAQSRVSHHSSLPPWIVREDTPPKKVLKSQDGTRLDSSSDLRRKHSLPGSPGVLPPIGSRKVISSQENDLEFTEPETHALAERLQTVLAGFDTSNLRNAYLTFTGFDSTLTGFVAAEQIEQVFTKCRIPLKGALLKLLIAKFMSAHRPNWVNYEQLLKFISDSSKPTVSKEFSMPRLDLTSNTSDRASDYLPQNSPRRKDITLKPNQVSPRRDDGMETGRQSAIAVKRAFQDRQDAHLLIQMERMLKQVDNANQYLYSLTRTLKEQDVVQAEYINSQKVSSPYSIDLFEIGPSLISKLIFRSEKDIHSCEVT